MATIIGTNGNDDGIDNPTLDGGIEHDLIQGLAGNDTLNGSDGNDTLEGGADNDVLSGGNGDDLLDGGDGNDTLNGDSSNDTLVGGAGDDTLNGGTSTDVLWGGAGSDVLNGGIGIDTVSYFDSGAAVTVSIISLSASASGGDADGDSLFSIESAIGSAYADVLTSNIGGSILEGAGGADTISGSGAARASYSLSDAGVTVALDANGDATGIGGHAEGDTLTGIIGLIGSAHGDTLSMVASVDRTLSGGGGDDILTLGSGNDTLDGGSGNDTMTGGAGNDTYHVDSPDDVIVESPGGGTDLVLTSSSHALSDNIENISTSNSFSTVALALTGNALDNVLTGGNGNDTLEGRAGADQVIGGGGFDFASYSLSSAAVTIDLAAGTISGGDAEGDTFSSIEGVIGSAYDDVLTGDGQGNTLDGGAGDDLLEGGALGDRLIGGDGIDTASYASSAFIVIVNLATGTGLVNDSSGDTLSGIENLIGGGGNDTLTGDDGANRLTGNGGNDTLSGGLGDDILTGGAGNDALTGGDGNDTADYSASAGAVTVNLASGAASGGDAQGDTLNAIENVIGSILADTLTASAAANALAGGDGDDTVSYAASASRVVVDLASGKGSGGHAAGDKLSSIENLTGSGFNDVLVGTGTANVLDGGGGNDILSGGAGADVLIGGLGLDTVTYHDSSAGVVVDLSLGTASGGDAAGDMLSSFENVTGSDFADALTGDGGANRLYGLDGDDAISGGDSRDVLAGGDGADTLNGDNGNDALKGEGGNDIIDGGAGNDSLNGGAGDDALTGGTGNDSYVVDSESDTIAEQEGEGNDRVTSSAASYTLSGHIETLVLTGAASQGAGNEQDNTIRGNALDNVLIGNGGVDRLIAGDGADTLVGGAGDDQLFGGAGDDTFVFGRLGSEGVDRINDWEEGDKLQIKVRGFGVDVGETVDIVTGTSTDGLVGNVLFYQSTTARLYFHDGESGVLTQFAALVTKPASLDAGDFELL